MFELVLAIDTIIYLVVHIYICIFGFTFCDIIAYIGACNFLDRHTYIIVDVFVCLNITWFFFAECMNAFICFFIFMYVTAVDANDVQI